MFYHGLLSPIILVSHKKQCEEKLILTRSCTVVMLNYPFVLFDNLNRIGMVLFCTSTNYSCFFLTNQYPLVAFSFLFIHSIGPSARTFDSIGSENV